MATMIENVIAVGSENRPLMLEKGMYDSWKTRIILYIQGKENSEMLKDSIDNGPYQLTSEITVKDTDGVTNIRRPQRVEDLAGQEKLRYDSDIKAVNILLLGLPVDIYTLINHYQTAKEIWDHVKEFVNPVGNAGANQTRVIRCYHCNGEGHITKLCTAKKRVKDSEWFKDKMLLAQAQEAGVVLNEEQQDFLSDSLEETNDCEDLQLQGTTNFKANHVDAYDSDCDDEATTNAIFMANLSPVGSMNDDTLRYIKNIVSNNESYDELMSNINVISYTDYMLTIRNDVDNYVPPPVQKNDMMLSVLLNLNNARDLLSKFDECIKRRTTLSPHQIGSWEQSDIKGAFKKDVIPFSENLKETFKLFEKGFIAEVKEMKDIFEQMKDEIESEPINAYFKNNRAVHRDYLNVTKEHVATLQELLEEARALKPLDEHIGHASKFAERIQELLVKNCNANDKNVALSKNSYTICLSCNECLFSANHDACVVQYLKKMQKCKMAKSVKQKIKSEWKPTGRILKTIGLKWIPTGRTFNLIVEIILWYLDSGCSKHMAGHRDKLINFVSKFIDLEVAFRKLTWVSNLEGVDLLSGSRGSNLYTISMADMMKSSPICLLSKASKVKSWLWYRQLSHLNSCTINQLAKEGLVKGLPKLKYSKAHLCSACQMGKRKKESHPHNPKPSTNEKL
ncbi:retrovirus-related pol polyprotein from transposon TNT 1-94 [Tanacetum coccineum]|uniref:Retrovirus-related pol polyprotein from transposon TNT 1-94 n=1 Tax=Tanacetum coccineum TaxID=301880 RepID=A0ABQ5DPH0_9ASTR